MGKNLTNSKERNKLKFKDKNKKMYCNKLMQKMPNNEKDK